MIGAPGLRRGVVGALGSAVLAASLAASLAACGPATKESQAPLYETADQRKQRVGAEDVAALYKGAEEAFQKGDLDGAEKAYREIARRDPSAIQARVRLAEIMKREHRYGDEERFVREILALEPERMEQHYALCWALLHEHREEEASKAFQASRAYGGQDEAMDLRIRGALALHAGHLDQATALFEELVRRDDHDASGWIGLGVVKAVAQDWDGSITELGRAEALAPKAAVVHYDLALAYYRKGDLERAVVEGRQAVELDPYFMGARNNLAATLVQLGKNDEAKATLEDAVKMRPTYAPAHNNLGVVRLATGDLPGAADELAKAIFHAPRVAVFHYNLALVKFRQGDVEGAHAEFEKVVTLDKKDVDAERNLRWLEGLEAGTIQGTQLPAAASHYAVDEFDE